jgi:hypothetical protein
MRIITALSILILASCSAAPVQDEETRAAEATDQCLANPELSREWGECNVKKTLFDNKEAIAGCQQRFGKSGESIMLQIRLRPDGRVRSVEAEEGRPRNRNLERCLFREISKLRFAAPPAGVKPVVYFPLQN